MFVEAQVTEFRDAPNAKDDRTISQILAVSLQLRASSQAVAVSHALRLGVRVFQANGIRREMPGLRTRAGKRTTSEYREETPLLILELILLCACCPEESPWSGLHPDMGQLIKPKMRNQAKTDEEKTASPKHVHISEISAPSTAPPTPSAPCSADTPSRTPPRGLRWW